MKKKELLIITGILAVCAVSVGTVLFMVRKGNTSLAAMHSSGDIVSENRVLTTTADLTQVTKEETTNETDAVGIEPKQEVSDSLVSILENISEQDFSEIIRGNDDSAEKQYVEVNLSGIDASLFSKRNVLLPVNYLSQLPELPTGCEITALTTVLNYWGYSVSKETMADNYLPKCDIEVGDFLNYFLGDPYTDYSFGCYANPIVVAANSYFSNNGGRHAAYNYSGNDFSVILKEVESGNPVVIWSTFERREAFVRPEFTWELANGQRLTWISPEHCVALIGYDLDSGTVTISDPMEGIVTCDLSVIDARYRQLASQAVAIRPISKNNSGVTDPTKNEPTTSSETKTNTAPAVTDNSTNTTGSKEVTTAASTKSTVQETTKNQ